MPSGGRREGSGRKPNSERYGPEIIRATDRCRDRLPQLLDNLEALANGQAPRVEEEYQPAGVITRKDLARDKKGDPIKDPKGKHFMVEVQVYPDLPADELVLVKRKIIQEPPHYLANTYLADRVLGKPVNAEEPADLHQPGPFNLDALSDDDFETLQQILARMGARPQPNAGDPGTSAADPPVAAAEGAGVAI